VSKDQKCKIREKATVTLISITAVQAWLEKAVAAAYRVTANSRCFDSYILQSRNEYIAIS